MTPTATEERTWGGNHAYRFARWERPTSEAELRDLVRGAAHVRAVGSRHSFNTICDSDDLVVDVSGLAAPPRVDVERRCVTVTAGTRFGEVAQAAHAAGLALHNMGSLPHISVVGAAATGTHGSGDHNHVLAAAVRRVRLLAADGSVVDHHRGEEGFEGLVLSLGAAGLVLELDLDLVPGFEVLQTRELVPWAVARDALPGVLGEAYSVSVFTRWSDAQQAEIWRKARVGDDLPSTADPARVARSVLLGGGPNLTAGDEPVAWLDGLPHFRLDHQPSFGEEIQSEFFVPREHTPAAVRALEELAPLLDPHLFVSEVRSLPADDLWLSPAYGRASTALHFTWGPDPAAAAQLSARVGEALEPFDVRPHWGKVFDLDAFGPERWRRLYPRLDDAAGLLARRDPEGRFLNDFTRRVLGRG